MEPFLLPHLFLATWVAVAFFLLRPPEDALAAPSFEGYVGTFVAANPPRASPETPFFDANGRKHRLSEYRGKVVLVNFWASWCPACIIEMPGLDRLQARLGGSDFVVVAISQDQGGVATVSRFLKSRGLEHLSLFIDDRRRLGLAFNQDMLPTTVLLDPDGREVGRLIGPADWVSPEAEALIRRYMRTDGKEVDRRPD